MKTFLAAAVLAAAVLAGGCASTAQGRKFDVENGTLSMQIDLYVDSAWDQLGQNVPGAEGRLASFWATGVDGGAWQELLNTDAPTYGGSGVGNLGRVEATPQGAHGRPASLSLSLR